MQRSALELRECLKEYGYECVNVLCRIFGGFDGFTKISVGETDANAEGSTVTKELFSVLD